ncbi:hypothetical protein ORI89_06430 [Sphingobacterium sp. UT-1RO-CII-1]|nr:hypothetical protein [Sphingobacterium sp. UT-1RO-CII-1]MCY4779278.1 hypothetical protein [Sphingobacterium sp. UT-1RO-CII-1]
MRRGGPYPVPYHGSKEIGEGPPVKVFLGRTVHMDAVYVYLCALL